MPDVKNTFHRLIKKPIVIIALIVVLVLIGVVWVFTHSQSPTPRNNTVAVCVATVTKEDAPLTIDALGTVNSTYTAVVKSRVDGQLMKVHFTEGQYVHEGQLLAELDARPYQAALMQAQGQLMRDQALLSNARIDLKRYQTLWDQNSISRQQLDTQTALVKQYEGTVRFDQGNVNNAKLQVSYSRITAPISGRVGLRQVDVGNIVHANDANGIVSITQDKPINVVFSIAEGDLTRLLSAYQNNPSLSVQAWDRENTHLIANGSILAIDNQLDKQTGTVGIKAKFDNTDGKLFPNQFVNIKLHLGNHAQATLIPTQAIQLGKLGETVYRVKDDQSVELVKIKTAGTSGNNTIITEGLSAGDTVVTDGVDKLRHGSKIRIVEPSNAPESPSDLSSPSTTASPTVKPQS